MTEERGALIEAMARAMPNEAGYVYRKKAARAALTAISNAGYAVVPMAPTACMLCDVRAAYDFARAPAAYRAMISASPLTTKGTEE